MLKALSLWLSLRVREGLREERCVALGTDVVPIQLHYHVHAVASHCHRAKGAEHKDEEWYDLLPPKGSLEQGLLLVIFPLLVLSALLAALGTEHEKETHAEHQQLYSSSQASCLPT